MLNELQAAEARRPRADGVLLSWAVPKGPSYDPADKRMAVHVEDHPISYGTFEGVIPPKQYGAGTVIVWDNGTWEPVGDPHEGMAKGKLLFKLHGQKLAGLWELVRIAKPEDKQDQWMLFKKRGDAWARPRAEYDVVAALPDSVVEKPLVSLSSANPELLRAPIQALRSLSLTYPAQRRLPCPRPLSRSSQLSLIPHLPGTDGSSSTSSTGTVSWSGLKPVRPASSHAAVTTGPQECNPWQRQLKRWESSQLGSMEKSW